MVLGVGRLIEPYMFFYECTPARQESCDSYATNATCARVTISYYFPSSQALSSTNLHAKVDRILVLLEWPQNEDEFAGLVGTMSTQEAAEFISISKRTFERKVNQGVISPIAKHMKKNRFSKQDVVRLYIAYRGYKPIKMP